MKMSRQHFELIAEVLADTQPLEIPAAINQWQKTISMFADKLAETNPLFDRDRFINAATNKKG